MDFNQLAQARKSVRGFEPADIPEEIIRKLLEAAQEAPSGGNCQPWHFYVIKNKEIIRQICDRAFWVKWLLTAPVVFVVCADYKRSEAKYGERGRDLYCIQDTAAAIENILLCAASLGIGTCWCGAFDENVVKEILELKDLRPVAMIPMGYFSGGNPKPKRRPVEEIATFL